MDEIKSSRPVGDDTPISPSLITGMIVGAALLIGIVHLGFYKTYIQFFPKFDGFGYVQHFHGAMMMGWLIMLLLQPILIRAGKYDLHRLVGRASYVLAPLVLVSMYLISQVRYESILQKSGQAAAVAHLALNFPNIVFFAVLYVLAIYYKHQTELHMRYMCSTAFVLIGPGLARALIGYMDLSLPDAVQVVRIATPLITGVLVVVDSVWRRRISPFVVVFGFMVLHTVLWNMRETTVWQTIGAFIAQLF